MRLSEKMDKLPTHLLNMGKLIEETWNDKVAYRRVIYALGDELGLKPEEVDRTIQMAKAGIKDELAFKEIRPGLYMGNTIQNLSAEPSEVAVKKGKPYIKQVLEHLEE